MVDVQEIKQKATGQWSGILDRLGIDVGNGKHKPCPACGGKDRFRFDDKNGSGSYICGQCGAGDSISLIQKTLGLSFQEAISRIDEILGPVKLMQPKKEKEIDVRGILKKIWVSSVKLRPNDNATKYFRKRGLMLSPKDIMYCRSCFESDSKTNMEAMIALVTNRKEKGVALHRTYLDGDKKADIENPKKMTPAIEGLQGCSIKLFEIIDDVVGIAEGIETAIAATQLFSIPTWSVINTSLMEHFRPPDGINKLVIFGDNDSNFSGQKAAYSLANKLVKEDYVVEVHIPEMVGDWNDELLQWRKKDASTV